MGMPITRSPRRRSDPAKAATKATGARPGDSRVSTRAPAHHSAHHGTKSHMAPAVVTASRRMKVEGSGLALLPSQCRAVPK